MISWQEFKARWRHAGWLDDVTVYERERDHGPDQVEHTTVSIRKVAIVIYAVVFVVYATWLLIEVIA